MSFFAKKTIRRLFFVLVYVAFSLWIVMRDFAWLNIVLSMISLFGGYVAIVKSKIIKDKNADGINGFSFDLFSLLLTGWLLVDVLISAIGT